jgi:hypothetical protein
MPGPIMGKRYAYECPFATRFLTRACAGRDNPSQMMFPSLHGWQVIIPAFLVELLQLLGVLQFGASGFWLLRLSIGIIASVVGFQLLKGCQRKIESRRTSF